MSWEIESIQMSATEFAIKRNLIDDDGKKIHVKAEMVINTVFNTQKPIFECINCICNNEELKKKIELGFSLAEMQ